MKKILGANWFVAIVGGLAYLGTTLFCFSHAKFEARRAVSVGAEPDKQVQESWAFTNPDLDQMIAALKVEQETLSVREQQAKDLEARLTNERQEINVVMEVVGRVQKELDNTIVRIKQEEIPNLKKLAKMHAAMSPDGSANILKEQSDEEVLKMLFYLKPSESGPILEAFGRMGQAQAKRASLLTERLRRSIEMPQEKAKP